MKTPAEAIAEFISAGRLDRQPLYRALVEFDSWMPPINHHFDGDTCEPFQAGMLDLCPCNGKEGGFAHPLCSHQAACEAYTARHGEHSYGHRGGWEIFGVAHQVRDRHFLIDPGTPHELRLRKQELPLLKAMADAVAVERAWKRIHAGKEEAGDLALVLGYGHYHLAAVQEPEGVVMVHVPHDDGRMFVPIFTHADALALALPEFERDFGDAVKTEAVSGSKAFPAIAREGAEGLVLNYRGPAEPLAFGLGITELLLEHLANAAPAEPEPAAPALVDPADVEEVARLSNEGVRLGQTQRAAEAEELLRSALALAEEKLGADHPSTAVALNNLGDFLSQNGRLEEAEPILRRAVAAKERLHGPEALETATAISNLALVLRRREWYAEAESLYRRVLPVFERGYGKESIEVASVLNNLAQVLQHTGRAAKAEPLMRRVIALFENNFGANHPNVAIALNNLARLLEESGRLHEAEPLSRRHLHIFQVFEEETGNRHAYKSSAIENYGDLLLRLGLERETAHSRIHALLRGEDVGDLGAERPAQRSAPQAAPDFDRLSEIANDAGASIHDQDALFGAAFRLEEWHFIARGRLPDVRPYVAANSSIVGGAPMVKAFTDTARLHAFARENRLTGPEGDVQILSMPVARLLGTMANLADQGVTHIHFNGDNSSYGFYVPLVQLPIIRQHLEKRGLL